MTYINVENQFKITNLHYPNLNYESAVFRNCKVKAIKVDKSLLLADIRYSPMLKTNSRYLKYMDPREKKGHDGKRERDEEGVKGGGEREGRERTGSRANGHLSCQFSRRTHN